MVDIVSRSNDRGEAREPRITPAQAAHALRRLVGIEADRIEYPGGASRSSVRAIAGEASFIVTRRRYVARAVLEAGVLRELHAAGAPVPAVLGFDGEWLVQQDLGPRRLSSVLSRAQAPEAAHWVAQAAEGLLSCQRAGERAGLARRVSPVGVASDWVQRVLATPTLLARQLDVHDPDAASAVAPSRLTPVHLSFVKWDARPGNSVLTANDGLAWIDWEHCGARDALDDLAWLLCDEYVPDDADAEAALLDRFVPQFARHSQRTLDDASAYLSRLGSFHSCMRLLLVLKHKGEGRWWDHDACVHTDRVCVTAEAARRLCRRGARWAGRWQGGERMQRFFLEADRRLRDLPINTDPVLPYRKHHDIDTRTALGATA